MRFSISILAVEAGPTCLFLSPHMVGIEGRVREVRDVVSPAMPIWDLYRIYYMYLLHYFEDFVAQTMPGSVLGFPQIPAENHGDQNTYSTQLRLPNMSSPLWGMAEELLLGLSAATQLRLPNMSSPLWGMAEELLTGLSEAIDSGTPERNIVSPPLLSSWDVVDQRAPNQAFVPSTAEPDLSWLLNSSSPELGSPARAIQAETEIPVMPEAKRPPTVTYSSPVEDLAGAEKKKVNTADPLPSATYEGARDGDEWLWTFRVQDTVEEAVFGNAIQEKETIDEEMDGRSSPRAGTNDDEVTSESF